MLAINMDDVINVLNSCKPYLIALGIALAIAIIVTVACMKLKKPVKKLVRKEAWIAFLMAAVDYQSDLLYSNVKYDLTCNGKWYDHRGNIK